jgi:hypothetical protein
MPGGTEYIDGFTTERTRQQENYQLKSINSEIDLKLI